MSFSEQTEKLTQDLIQAEYLNACEKFGEKYNSLHEGYAVLLEEVEESENEFARIKTELSFLWSNIKYYGEHKIKFNLDVLQKYTQNAIKELAQVGAVLMKIKNTLLEKDKVNHCLTCEVKNFQYGCDGCKHKEEE